MKRRIEEIVFKTLMIFSLTLVIGSLFLIVITIIVRAAGSFNLDMIIKAPTGGFYYGKEGGILNAIIGSFYIAGASTLIGLLLSIPIVMFINVYMKKSSLTGFIVRLGYDVLFGVPSIIYGVFGFTIIIYFGLKTSLLGGIIAVTFLVVPIMVCTLNEIIKTVPQDLMDASYSLGFTKLETVKIVAKQIYPGIVTALLLSFTRAIGDAASVLFTAGYSDSIPTRLDQPAATLPLAIFFQLGSPIKEVQNRAYAAALLLTIVVLLISITARWMSRKFSKHII